MHRWDRLMAQYMDWYAGRGLVPETVRQTQRELERWGNWTKRRRPQPNLEQFSSDLIVTYIRDRHAFKAKTTLSGNLSIMRGFGEFLVYQGIWPNNPLRWIKGPKLDPRCQLPRRLSRAALKQLWQTAATSRESHYRYLWILILSLLYGTGIRRGELARLDVEHWDSQTGSLQVDGRKSGQERMVAVPPLVHRCLESYLPRRHNVLEHNGHLEEKALLVNKLGGRLGASAISRGIHRLANRAGIRLGSVHQFRHTCASDLLEEGMSLPEVKAVLGHQHIGTTVRYLHITDPQKHEAIKRHPINEWLGGPHSKEAQS